MAKSKIGTPSTIPAQVKNETHKKSNSRNESERLTRMSTDKREETETLPSTSVRANQKDEESK